MQESTSWAFLHKASRFPCAASGEVAAGAAATATYVAERNRNSDHERAPPLALFNSNSLMNMMALSIIIMELFGQSII